MKHFRLVTALALASAMTAPTGALAFQSVTPRVGDLRWDQATVLAGFLKPSGKTPDILGVNLANGRTLKLPHWPAGGRPAKGLWIEIPGTGSDADGDMANFIAEHAAEGGYDVIVVPNPFSPSFQMNASADGIIGFPQRDLDDVVPLVNDAYSAYASRYGEPAKVNILGVSLGASYALLLGQRDRELKFGVEKYVAVNPPVQFQYAMDQLDSMIQNDLSQPAIEEYERQITYLLPLLLTTYQQADSPGATTFSDLRGLASGGEALHRQIIGAAFQGTLRTIADNLAGLPAFADASSRRSIADHQESMTFGWYEGFAGMHIKNDARMGRQTIAELAHAIDVSSVLASSSRVSSTYVISTKDDFLLAPGDLDVLDRRFGDRLFVFSSGGHCGEIWFKEFENLIHGLAQ